MKRFIQFIIGGIVGFIITYAFMNFSGVRFAGEIAVIGLTAVSIILLVWSIVRFQKIKSLNFQQFSGVEEDEVEERKYKLFADYSLFTNISFVFSLLALSLSLITTQNLMLTVVSLLLVIVSFLFIQYMIPMMKHVYPDRDFPNKSDSNDAQGILTMADDGEKHVILNGLYKAHSLLNGSLITAIILSTIYSMTKENAQTFSIILMALVLLAVNSNYLFVVRNK
ncbi:DUF3169 family protein [Radiobacillus deserti]|uniref:DUF3169 family protein n=1 Tax=Radiobacillus deserti TaxID=2594883 RepID=A0A516KJC9_9BACI|nr:DUF3169 family protein [Radiobacillus deserti]QDP41503.1 DUF3169 family protein [Radiobacillus deserti]